ncbi:hypothetical protein LLH00_05280 [bacterium]|nr:hypothetical protein [bacterium]
MSGKTSAAKSRDTQAENALRAADRDSRGDFWGNFFYFLVLSIAITFILANNTVQALTSTTGAIILGLLVLLDVFPAFHLARHFLYDRD